MLVLLLLCLIRSSACQGPPGAPEPKYVLNFESSIYVCGEDSAQYIDTSRIMVERYNESTAFMHGEIVFPQGLAKVILEIIVRKEASGKFEDMFTHDICDFCKELGNPDSDYKRFLQHFGFPCECPFDAGAYKVNDLILDTDEFELCDTHIGRYEAVLNMYSKTGENCNKDGEELVILKIDLSVEQQ